MSITIELPQETGELLMKAIEVAAASIDAEAGETFFMRQADAIVDIAKSYLQGDTGSGSTADHYQVMIHVDETALRDQGGQSDLPIESIRRITCDASVVELTKDDAGNPLNVGRKHRVVSPPLKRALLARDKHCRFPGCTHDRWLDAHHVMHWVDGGETSLANTLLLCGKHHRLLHEGGFTIERKFADEFYFRSSTGRVVADLQCVNPIRDGFEVREVRVAYLPWARRNTPPTPFIPL